MKKLKTVLQEYVDKGLISARNNGDGLTIYNYTQQVQFDGPWDYYTKMARGLILDDDGNIIARPFAKFFNLNQTDETALKNLPDEKPEVSEKIDGSLGILYKWRGKYRIASRGAFESEQAVIAQKILDSKYSKTDFDSWGDFTFLFEIVYPENRIVVDYGETRDIILIGMVHKEDGGDYSYADVIKVAKELGLPHVASSVKTFDEVFAEIENGKPNTEGFVLRYSNGLRVKCKTDEYVRLHKILTGINDRHIWEMLKDNIDRQKFLENVPDEFHKWFSSKCSDLTGQYGEIVAEAKRIFGATPKDISRREIASIFTNARNKKYSAILFKMLDEKPYDESVWKMIRPSGEDRMKAFFNSADK